MPTPEGCRAGRSVKDPIYRSNLREARPTAQPRLVRNRLFTPWGAWNIVGMQDPAFPSRFEGPMRLLTRRVTGRVVGAVLVGTFAPMTVQNAASAASAESARVWLVNGSGATVASAGEVVVGYRVVAHVSGFAPGTTVSVQLEGSPNVRSLIADATGAGEVPTTVSKLPLGPALFVASGGGSSATARVTIADPNQQPIAPTATPTQATPISAHASAAGTITATVEPAASSSTAAGAATLPKTGGSAAGPSIAGLLLLAVGAALARAGSKPEYGVGAPALVLMPQHVLMSQESSPQSAAEGVQPTRAELRRAREGAPPPDRDEPPLSRSALRNQREQQQRSSQRRRSILTAWWFYPLAAAIVVCLVLAVRAGQSTPPSSGSVTITDPSTTSGP